MLLGQKGAGLQYQTTLDISEHFQSHFDFPPWAAGRMGTDSFGALLAACCEATVQRRHSVASTPPNGASVDALSISLRRALFCADSSSLFQAYGFQPPNGTIDASSRNQAPLVA
ncbi:MAG: hypothetical protein B6A08_12755 [Sorangiineae bacterium NIC37A_2]|nr:MAG: hypothetical protein B6A08_12755 [Sorangiineae bacterium NIC37A_2]